MDSCLIVVLPRKCKGYIGRGPNCWTAFLYIRFRHTLGQQNQLKNHIYELDKAKIIISRLYGYQSLSDNQTMTSRDTVTGISDLLCI